MNEEKNEELNEATVTEPELKETSEAEAQPECEPTKKEKHALKKECEQAKAECKSLTKKLEQAQSEKDEINDKYLRLLAEFDNFKKRSAKESEGIYSSCCADVVNELLPVFDNLERAVDYAASEESKSGLEMILSSFIQTLKKLGVEQFGTPGDEFDANIHSAVMHIEDENYGENVICEVFQKGYKRGDKVIRYAMVKVAN